MNFGSPGTYVSERVLMTNPNIVIPSGTSADYLATSSVATALTTATVNGNSFCSISVVRVPHFRNLTLASGLTYSNPFNFSTGDLGVIPFRVNQVLSLSGTIDLTGAGYLQGQYPTNMIGAGNQRGTKLKRQQRVRWQRESTPTRRTLWWYWRRWSWQRSRRCCRRCARRIFVHGYGWRRFWC